jgi:MFS family permease
MKINRNYLLLSIIAILQGLVFYGPIATLYRESRGITIYQIFILESILMLLMILFEIPWGWFADKFGYKNTLLIAFLLNFISKIIFYKADSFSMFLIERIILAVSLAGVSGCDIALLYNSVGEAKADKAFSWYNAFSAMGYLIATLCSAFIISVSMDFTVWITIFPYGFAVILALFIKEVPHESNKKESFINVLKIIGKSKHMIPFLFSIALITEVSHSIMVFLNQLQYKRSGIDVKYYGFILAVVQVASMLTSQTYKVTRRFGEYKTFVFITCTITISCFLLAKTSNPLISVLLIVLIGLVQSISLPISSNIQNKSITIANRATVLSAYAMTIDVFSSSVNIVIGKASSYSIQISFILCGIITFSALLLSIYFFKTHKGKSFIHI